MSALGSLVVKLALDHAEFTKGINKNDQAALKFAKNTQDRFEKIDRQTKQFFKSFAAGALGAVASIAGIAGSVRKFNQAIDELADLSALSQRTGIAVEALSQLDRVIKDTGGSIETTVTGIDRLAQGMARVDNPSNLVLNALKAVDVQAHNLDGTLRDSGDVFVDLSKKLAQYQDGTSKTALVMDIFGRSGAKLLPVMNNVAARIDDTATSSTQAAQQAEAYNNAVGTLGRRFDDLFTSISSQVLPTMLKVVEAMSSSDKAASGFSKAGAVLSEILKRLAVSAVTINGTFKLLGDQIGGRAAQLVALANLDFKGASKIGDELSKSFDRIKNDVGDTIDSILDADQELAEAIERTGKKQLEFTSGQVQENERLAKSKEALANKEQKENERILKSVEKLNAEREKERQVIIGRGRALTLSLDPFARYNNEVRELNQLIQAGAINQRIFDLELENINKRFQESVEAARTAKDNTKDIFGDLSQFAIQGARNIQTSLADALLDSTNGFKSFAKNVLDIFKRLAAQIASVKLLQGLGIQNLFGGGSGGSNIGSSGGLISQLLPGVNSSGSLGGVSSVLGAGALSVGIGSALAGDKRLFGLNGTVTSTIGTVVGAALGPVGGILGSSIGAIFGRGPLKQKDSLFRGTLTAEGIGDDFLTATNFKAKGGLLRGDKVDRVIINANTGELINGAPGLPESGISSKLLPFADDAAKQALQIGQLFDTTIKGFNSSLRSSADVLGIGATALDKFNTFIQVTSEKGEAITEQQVAEAIADIGNQMATTLVPGIESFAKSGETALAALQRVTSEFTSLEDALIVFGKSALEANAAVSALSINTRTGLVDAAGGIDALNSQVTFFANNFLSAQEQLNIGFDKLDREMQKLGLSANLTTEQYKDLIISVTKSGGASVEMASALLKLAPQFLAVKSAEEQVAAESARASGQLSGLAGSIANVASASTASFQRIDNARAALENAQRGLATAEAQASLSGAQNELSRANEALSTARSNLAAAQSAEQSRASNQINAVISERNELISAYQSEAQALKSVVDRFGALSDKIVDFKDSLAISNLSPLSPGEQLTVARQQFNVTRNLAAKGDERALDRLPEVSRTFLEASKTFNGATGAFESDFNFVQQVLESSGAAARATRDIAGEQLAGIEGTISELKALNDATQRIDSGIGQISESVLSVEDALAAVQSATADVAAAQANVDSATAAVNEAVIANGGFINEVARATNAVEVAVRELGAAILQGFGNLAISDRQIVDFINANPQLSDAQIVQQAIKHGVSVSQLQRATGVPFDRISRAAQGQSVRDDQIAAVVNQKLQEGDLLGIYQAARANGITSQRLADSSQLTKEQIDQFVQANNLQPFRTGTDFVQRDGIAMLHKGEAVVPSSTTAEIKALRAELAQLRREQNQQMSALINITEVSNKQNAETIVKSNREMSASANWRDRSRPKAA